MPITTSYYAKNGANPNAFSISAKAPDFYTGKSYKLLAPTWEIITAVKNGKISELQYIEQYMNLLFDRGVTPEQILNDLPENAILLCYEKSGDFCHRRIVAKWIEQEMGIAIKELDYFDVDDFFEF